MSGSVPLAYQAAQIVTVVAGVSGAAVTGWAMARTLRDGVAETRFGRVPRDRYPRSYRALVAVYGIGVVVLLSAAAAGGALLLTGGS
ncbi:hypothetical protein [Enterovirga rhinocerotis]|uniref:Uncharacterized protein n=1 Tax=Enterovirga rhinocerotis TaxID=1339210 RepID=A0A4R7C8I5_9HYPH|nr:hypothetical protein [Enterovirga rhinocerotis]TDR94940.1 hypothetical protein EV668_2232 [Enterovirga rhinocerotis]